MRMLNFKKYGVSEGRIPNPFFMINSILFRNLFFFLSILGCRLYETETIIRSNFRLVHKIVINVFFWYEYRFLKKMSIKKSKIYLTSWVDGGVSDALGFYIRRDLENFDTIIVLRSLKLISLQKIPILKVEVYSKDTEHPTIHTCPFPSSLLSKLFANSPNAPEVDIHHVFGFEKFLDYVLDNFVTKFNVYVHDYYLFSDNWSFFNVNISSDGCITDYFKSQVNVKWSYSSREHFITNCNTIIATSYHTYKLLKHERGFPVEKLEFRYIPEESNLESMQSNFLKKVPRENKKIKILILGNLGIYKGLRILNSIVNELTSENYDFTYYHFGNVSEGELSNKILSYGWLNRKERQIEIERVGADLALLTAQSPETYSMILSELFRLKIPIVSSKIGALTERLFDCKNALLISNYSSSKSWVKEIINFCDNHYLNCDNNSEFDAEETQLILQKRNRS